MIPLRPIALLSALVCALAIIVTLALTQSRPFAQDTPPPPLTETQKLKLANALQRVQIAQYELKSATGEAQTLIKSLSVPGYDISLQTFEYVKQVKK